ncbi:MAG: chlorite dismutase family protein [Alphaproteobacteria bacterium]|nr:chlorite dismutase family protein [Alphaproteobacteria bacterium]
MTEQHGHDPEHQSGPEPIDISEKGRRGATPISLDRRLFMRFTAYGGCSDPAPVIDALTAAGVVGALYLEVGDPTGVGLAVVNEDPDYFVDDLRVLLNREPFANLARKEEFEMFGRTYAIGYESDLEHVLFSRPIERITDPALRWAVWYPLQRTKGFAALDAGHQRQILAEHGTLGHRFGSAGLAHDIRLACHGLDKHDNDFIVGLVGAELHPLSAVVQAMRGTEQTSQYLDSLGPFFVGRVAWQGRGAIPDGSPE